MQVPPYGKIVPVPPFAKIVLVPPCSILLYLVLISALAEKHTFGYLFMKALKFNKNSADVSISEKLQSFDDFSGFCSLDFDSFLRDLTIFRLKCNEQHFSIPKSHTKILVRFS